MVEGPPDIRYVDRGGSALAYQCYGEGPANLVLAAEIGGHLSLMWTDPGYTAVLRHIGERCRTAMFERHGTGLSDPLPAVRPVEDEAEDLLAVMDACAMEEAVVVAFFTRAAGVLLAAARHPERIAALVIVNPVVQGWRSAAVEELEGWTADEHARWERAFEAALGSFGTGATMPLFVPGLQSPRNSRIWGLLERASASPGVMRANWEAAGRVDVRDVLPLVRARTVVVRNEDAPWPRAVSESVADAIPGAEFLEVDGGRPDMNYDEFWRPLAEIALRMTGAADGAAEASRRLATVAFTDIVGSTELAARIGDARWRALLEHHDDLARRVVAEERGRVVKHTGDGMLSVFDGPAQAIQAGRRLTEAVRSLDVEVRVGIHTGECEIRGDDLAGLGVHIGARVGALAAPGEVLVSRTVRDLVVGSGISFTPRGAHALKGVPGEWELFAVGGAEPLALPDDDSLLRPSDRVLLAAASRAPGVLRRLNGLVQRGR